MTYRQAVFADLIRDLPAADRAFFQWHADLAAGKPVRPTWDWPPEAADEHQPDPNDFAAQNARRRRLGRLS